MATMVRLMMGSSQTQPSSRTPAPASTTPTEMAASAAMWRKAARMLRSLWRPRAKSMAVKPLMSTPMAATTIMVPPLTGAGSRIRPTASQAMPAMANNSSSPLARAARMVVRRSP
jgi:hypothetical protein